MFANYFSIKLEERKWKGEEEEEEGREGRILASLNKEKPDANASQSPFWGKNGVGFQNPSLPFPVQREPNTMHMHPKLPKYLVELQQSDCQRGK